MHRRLLLAALAVLALVAVLLWIRGSAISDGAAQFERSTELTRPTPAHELAAPVGMSSPDPSTAVSPPIAVGSERTVARATWTGVRVRVVAVEDAHPLAAIDVGALPQGTSFQLVRLVLGTHALLGETATTEDAGVVELELTAGTSWSLHASSRSEDVGLGSMDVEPLEVGEVRELTLRLPTTHDVVLFGRVVDVETGLPLARVRVGAADGWGRIRTDDDQVTDSDGRFRVQGASWKRMAANVIASGYELACVAIVPGYEIPERALEVQLGRTGTLRVVLLDREGSPMARYRIRFSAEKHRFVRPSGEDVGDLRGSNLVLYRDDQDEDADLSIWTADTNEAGEAVLTDLPARMPLDGLARNGAVELWHTAEPIVLEPGETRTVEWRLGSACTLRGVALESDGTPTAQLVIALEPADSPGPEYFDGGPEATRRVTLADAAGRFEFADVGAGDWRVGPAPKDSFGARKVGAQDFAPFGQYLRIDPGVGQIDVEVRVHRGLSVEGRLLDPSGNPAAGGVLLIDAEGAFRQSNSVDANGHFTIGPLRAGPCELSGSGFGPFVRSLPVSAAAGDHDVVLRLRSGVGLRVTVVDASNGTACTASVLARAKSSGEWRMASSRDERGVVQFDALVPDLYDLSANTPDGRVGVLAGVELAPNKPVDGLRIGVEPGARVRVRHAGRAGYLRVEVFAGNALIATDALESGMDRAFAAPVGDVLLRASTYPGPKQFDLPLTLAVGETRDVVFDGAWK